MPILSLGDAAVTPPTRGEIRRSAAHGVGNNAVSVATLFAWARLRPRQSHKTPISTSAIITSTRLDSKAVVSQRRHSIEPPRPAVLTASAINAAVIVSLPTQHNELSCHADTPRNASLLWPAYGIGQAIIFLKIFIHQTEIQ